MEGSSPRHGRPGSAQTTPDRQTVACPPPDTVPIHWSVRHSTGSAQDFHALDPEAEMADSAGHGIWVHRLDRPALVLGSAQKIDLIDSAAATEADVEVCRRRSGGGMVYIQPRSDVWIDMIVPTGSPLWDDDVGRSFLWLGRYWAGVLVSHFGLEGGDNELAVATAPRRDRYGRLVCFAAVGNGEVTWANRKVIGLSQRRNRSWARIQGLCLVRSHHRELAPLINGQALAAAHPELFGATDQPVDQAAIARLLADVDRISGLPADMANPDPDALIDRFITGLTAA